MTGEWCLEGGALVLADTGFCLIDEFDKMGDSDRTSIHEAMEQQSISISKAGIVANLRARCSVIAAANPVKGVYDERLSFQDNVDLSDPIISRFDVLCVLKDNIDIVRDQKMADFIINSHSNNHPDQFIKEYPEEEDRIKQENIKDENFKKETNSFSQSFLKKFIFYARENCKPQLTKSSGNILQNFYVRLRNESKKSSGLNIVVRHLESLIRLASASAKLHLRKQIIPSDCHLAISILLNSFMSTQKPSIAMNIKQKFSFYLKQSHSSSSKLSYLLNKLLNQQIVYKNLVKKTMFIEEEQPIIRITMREFELVARENNIQDLNPFLNSEYFTSNFKIVKEKDQELILKRI